MVRAWLALALCAGPAQAASIVVLQKGDGADQVLTATTEDGATERSLTLICEPAVGKFGLVLQSVDLAGTSDRLALRVDGARVRTPSGLAAPGSLTLLLDGRSGRDLVRRLTAGRLVEAMAAGRSMRFALSDGKAAVASFRRLCSL